MPEIKLMRMAMMMMMIYCQCVVALDEGDIAMLKTYASISSAVLIDSIC